jgi:hypothetical protein
LKTEKYPRRPWDAVVWRDDLVPLLLPNGFEMGWSRTTAYKRAKQGNLWQVAVIGPKLINTMWYDFGESGLADDANPSRSHGWMSRSEFREKFCDEPV